MFISKSGLLFTASLLATSLTSSLSAMKINLDDNNEKKIIIYKNEKNKILSNTLIELEKGSTYSAVAKAPSGAKLYFNMVKVTDENYDFWKTYMTNVTPVSGDRQGVLSYLYSLHSIKDKLGEEEYNKKKLELMKIVNLTSKDFDDLIKRTKSHDDEVELKYKDNKREMRQKLADQQFQNLAVGIAGARSSLVLSREDKHVYVAFASTAPLKDIDQQNSPVRCINDSPVDKEKLFKDFEKSYGNIVMSVNVLHNPKAPTSTHFGIFRNPLDIHRAFLKGENPHRDIAMILHGFAATVEQTYFHDKIYMNTWPPTSMTKIFVKALGEDAIEPISNIYPLVKDLKESWDFSQLTGSGKPTAIKLQALVPLFTKAEVKE